MPDTADLDTMMEELRPGSFDVGNHQVASTGRPGWCISESDANLDGAGGARWGQLDNTKVVGWVVVNVDGEANLLAIEGNRPVDIAHGDRDHFEPVFHHWFTKRP